LLAASLLAVLPREAISSGPESSTGKTAGAGASSIELGRRPLQLVDGLRPGALKRTLAACSAGPFSRTDFSIAHRGAPRAFAEHTAESYRAAARQGAGILECDVTFTRDGTLVCRHDECDLHSTTNILLTDLANQCSSPFTPYDVVTDRPASARCCSSDLSLQQFKQLKGKNDFADPRATTVTEYVGDRESLGTLLTHRQSVELFRDLGVKFTPELKQGNPQRLQKIFGGATAREAQQRYARAMIDEYVWADIPPDQVWPQSFNLNDIVFWLDEAEAFGRQAVYLDGRSDIDPNDPDVTRFSPTMGELAKLGVNIIAPPIPFLLRVTDEGELAPSAYADAARQAGLEIITWTLERSDLRGGSRTGGIGADGLPNTDFYYQFDRNPSAQAIRSESDMYEVLDVLARRVGIRGIFSDWPATVTYYANCMGL
jgi:glycerophosphoryl diester phosphodiesterase